MSHTSPDKTGEGGRREHPYPEKHRGQQPTGHDEADGELVHQVARFRLLAPRWPGLRIRHHPFRPRGPVSISCWACSSTVSMSGIPTGSASGLGGQAQESEKLDE